MKIGGYEIPMADTIIPWSLSILLVCVVAVFARRLWNDKELTLKKVATMVASIVLIFVTVLYMGDLVVWGWGCVCKIAQIATSVKV